MRRPSVLVVAGGNELSSAVASQAFDRLIAADSGVDLALGAGLSVDVAIGDFDSVSVQGLATARRSGARVVTYPEIKDQTDLELALLEACLLKPASITVVGLGGGRLDHLLANYALLADSRFANYPVDAIDGAARVSVIHRSRTIEGQIGELVSLLPVGGDAVGVTTTGLAYALNNTTLRASSPLGVSNLMTGGLVAISVTAGVLLAIQPEHY